VCGLYIGSGAFWELRGFVDAAVHRHSLCLEHLGQALALLLGDFSVVAHPVSLVCAAESCSSDLCCAFGGARRDILLVKQDVL